MAHHIPGLIEWEVREVPVADRGPIVEKTLDLLEESDIPYRLLDLDQMDLLALIRIDGVKDEEELRGLYWVCGVPREPKTGMLAFGWLDLIGFDEGAATASGYLRDAIDDWARSQDFETVLYYTREGYKKAKVNGAMLGFKPSPLREFRREVPPLRDVPQEDEEAA